MDASQDGTVAWLAGQLGGEAREIRTHISRVLLGADTVFKLKRAVSTPYLDFSTPERRLAACRREVDLNRRTAPSLYREARAVTAGPGGGLAFDGAGPLVDAVVVMARFPDDALLDAAVLEGRAGPAEIDALAGVIAGFHAAATVDRGRGGHDGMAAVLAINEAGLARAGLVSDDRRRALCGAFRAALERHGRRLERRRIEGRVRHCHGDLTLRNIALVDGVPTPFDCIEFDDDIATVDVLYDLAFPLMDLWHRGRPDLANRLFNRTLDLTGDTADLALVPFFIGVRAAVRAHVTGAQALDGGPSAAALRDEALAYLDLAEASLAPGMARLVAVGGLSGSGKSTVAAGIAAGVGPLPGARVVGSDRLRKRWHGVPATRRLPPEAYAPEVSRRVYATLMEEACAAAAQGHGAVAEAVFDRPADRQAVASAAGRAGVPFRGIWLDAPTGVLAARVRARTGDPSDADEAVVAQQAARTVDPEGWTRIPAEGSPAEVLAAVRAVVADG